jgi:hypothetical protein
MMGGVVNAPRNGAADPRSESRLKVLPQTGTASGSEGAPDQEMKPNARAADALEALSERERDELDQLRQQFAELRVDRDAAARLIKEVLRR